ncbi:MAG: hypothetical protein U0319_10675 [Nitrospira sp.]
MERAKLEFTVGIFVLVGIACLGYLSIKLGKLEVIGGHNYPIEAEFTSASGTEAGSVGGDCRGRGGPRSHHWPQ